MSDSAFEMSTFNIVRQEMDLDWYVKVYGDQIKAHSLPDEPPEYFYLRAGARMGHDPHPYFSEIFFRLKNEAVGMRMMSQKAEFGFLIYLVNREAGKAADFELPDFHTTSLLRRVVIALDTEYIAENHSDDVASHLSVADFYISRNMGGEPVDPHAQFSEAYYLRQHADVAAAQQRGALISGFQHYLAAGKDEERTILSSREYNVNDYTSRQKDARIHLEENFPGITKPYEIGTADALSRLMRPLDIEVSQDQPRQIHVFLMQFFPEIFFGGYGAFFDFLRRMKQKTGLPIRLYVCGTDDWRVHSENLRRMRSKARKVLDTFDEVILFSGNQTSIVLSPECEIWSYSAETHFMASQAAEKVGKKPYFFIQDDETMFHPNNSVSSFTYSAFLLPHFGIVNSGILLDYLKQCETFPKINEDYEGCSFENRILKISTTREQFHRIHTEKEKRRLIIYGRPELHAARNQFAFIVTALRMAIDKGIFDDTWEFFGIGSLDFAGDVALSKDLMLHQLVRISKEEYEDFIASGDIGISMISTPHPGIIHFQMAAFGLTTITNTGFSRTDKLLSGISKNLIPVDLSIQGLLSGLETAKTQSMDFEARYENAKATDAAFDNATVDMAVELVSNRILNSSKN